MIPDRQTMGQIHPLSQPAPTVMTYKMGKIGTSPSKAYIVGTAPKTFIPRMKQHLRVMA